MLLRRILLLPITQYWMSSDSQKTRLLQLSFNYCWKVRLSCIQKPLLDTRPLCFMNNITKSIECKRERQGLEERSLKSFTSDNSIFIQTQNWLFAWLHFLHFLTSSCYKGLVTALVYVLWNFEIFLIIKDL